MSWCNLEGYTLHICHTTSTYYASYNMDCTLSPEGDISGAAAMSEAPARDGRFHLSWGKGVGSRWGYNKGWGHIRTSYNTIITSNIYYICIHLFLISIHSQYFL